MKFLVLVAVVVACVAASPIEEQKDHVSTLLDHYQNQNERIISGSPARYGQFPWQVAVHFTTSAGTSFCGGALISPQWVLTAAHCAKGARSFSLKLGGLTLNSQESGRVDVTTSNYVVHPSYNSNLNYDIALVKMTNAVTLTDRIRTIRLPSRGEVVAAGVRLTVSGWGKTSDNGGISNTLNFVELTSITNQVCAQTYGNSVIIASTLCCKGNPQHSTCSGDSGGPLVSIKNGVATHVGIVSFVHSSGCASGKPSGYVRTESLLSWIQQQTGITMK